MFEHIASNINIEYPMRGPLLVEYGHVDKKQFTGIKYYDTRQTNPVWSLIKEKARKYWSLSFMEISGSIMPHTDSNAATVINVYGQTNNGVTRFYQPNVAHLDKNKIKNQTNGNIFKLEQLTEIGSFVAKDNDAWLLDVSKIHAVEMQHNNARWAYCLSTPQVYNVARKQITCLQ
jgi:hypothetical protein